MGKDCISVFTPVSCIILKGKGTNKDCSVAVAVVVDYRQNKND